MARERMEYDLLIIGAGPAGLAAACRAAQLTPRISICVLEKGAEIGAHNVSGAVLDTRSLTELFPEWRAENPGLAIPVQAESWLYLPNSRNAIPIPRWLHPHHNQGNVLISLSQMCRWLGQQAASLGVELYPGFAASELLLSENGAIAGVITGDMGRDAHGNPKSGYSQGIEICAKYTLFCEGARGHLGKQLIRHFSLDKDQDPQHYALGIKEIWRVPDSQHQPGLVIHTLGWPLAKSATSGGGFLYHLDNHLISVGLVTDLSYRNPHLSPFHEFQGYKHHPSIAPHLIGGERLEYAARVLVKGGPQSQPQMTFPGGLLLGDDAGTLNMAQLKGNHTAMKSGMIGAEVAVRAIHQGRSGDTLTEFQTIYFNSWAYQELWQQRNLAPAQQRWGTLIGGAYGLLDSALKGILPWTLRNPIPDHLRLQPVSAARPLHYPKPDGQLSFDKLSSVYISNTYHTENQPCHLQLLDDNRPIEHNLPVFNEPAQRYCPAGVYEVVTLADSAPKLQINAQNCIHCKACDIKDPTQNIHWVPPEGGGGPKYSNS